MSGFSAAMKASDVFIEDFLRIYEASAFLVSSSPFRSSVRHRLPPPRVTFRSFIVYAFFFEMVIRSVTVHFLLH